MRTVLHSQTSFFFFFFFYTPSVLNILTVPSVTLPTRKQAAVNSLDANDCQSSLFSWQKKCSTDNSSDVHWNRIASRLWNQETKQTHSWMIITCCPSWPFPAGISQCSHCQTAQSKCFSMKRWLLKQNGLKWPSVSAGLRFALGNHFCKRWKDKFSDKFGLSMNVTILTRHWCLALCMKQETD